MAVNLNDVDDFEDGEEKQVIDQDLQNNGSITNQDNNTTGDGYVDDEPYNTQSTYGDNGEIIEDLLKSKGIDPNSVKFQNNEGEIEEKNFNDLTKDEQLQILNYNDLEDDYGLNDNEVQLINQLRANNLSVEDYNNYIAKQAVQNYIQQNSNDQPVYQVESIPDDELYLIDLKARIPELSDDEAVNELEQAKSNEDLYNKKVQSIREEYQQKEDLLYQQQQQEEQEKYEQQAKEFEGVIVDAVQNSGDIDVGDSSLSLSNDDKNEIASFILDSDATGTRYIAKALNDPQTLVKMVWYALKGDEAFGQVSDYYKQRISEAARYNYNKGYEDAKSGRTANNAKSVVRKTSTNKNKPLTINDID